MPKTCSRCKVDKPLESFRKCGRSKDGRRQPCLPCAVASEAETRKFNRDKLRANHAAWRAKNPDRVRYHSAQSRARNPEKHAERSRAYREKNPDVMRKSARKYYERNKEKVLEKTRNRPPSLNAFYTRMYQLRRTRAAPPWLTEQHKAQIKAFYDAARVATQITGVLHHVDHIFPIKGKTSCGLHVPWNLQILTAVENSQKHNRMPEGME